jgi:Na+/proline symporter
MQSVDYAIIVAYLTVLAIIGLVLARRAGQSAEHYFLGGRALPWWALGSSGMASNLRHPPSHLVRFRESHSRSR